MLFVFVSSYTNYKMQLISEFDMLILCVGLYAPLDCVLYDSGFFILIYFVVVVIIVVFVVCCCCCFLPALFGWMTE